MIFTTLKAKLYAGAGIALGVLLVAVRVLTKQNSRLRSRVENAEAKANHARVVAQEDIHVEKQTRSHRADLINELEEDNDSTGFRDPNKLFDDTDD